MLFKEERCYTVKRVKDGFKWEDIEKAPIDRYCWDYGYEPVAYGQFVFLNEKEFIAKLTCFEKDPYAKLSKYGEEAWTDSCLEFFAAFDAKRPDFFANLEMASKGAAYMAIGYPGEDRPEVHTVLGHIPNYKPEILEDRWTVELRLSIDEIRCLFGDVKLESGYKFPANLYKCGDNANPRHFGMWSRCVSVLPAFHMPKYFGTFIME